MATFLLSMIFLIVVAFSVLQCVNDTGYSPAKILKPKAGDDTETMSQLPPIYKLNEKLEWEPQTWTQYEADRQAKDEQAGQGSDGIRMQRVMFQGISDEEMASIVARMGAIYVPGKEE